MTGQQKIYTRKMNTQDMTSEELRTKRNDILTHKIAQSKSQQHT